MYCCLQTLGKRYKEAMPKLKAAIQKLDREQIMQFEEGGTLTVEGCLLERGDLKVMLFFAYPPVLVLVMATVSKHAPIKLAVFQAVDTGVDSGWPGISF